MMIRTTEKGETGKRANTRLRVGGTHSDTRGLNKGIKNKRWLKKRKWAKLML